jgi:hypothetical protein
MLVKDEADIVGYTVEHLLGQVDHVIVADNGSTDGTKDILGRIQESVSDGGFRLTLIDDDNPAYYQSQKTTELAMLALDAGHSWVVPCDADEWWYATDGRRLADFLDGLAPDVQIVDAPLYNHLPTALDPPAECDHCRSSGIEPGLAGVPCRVCAGEVRPNPFARLGWRKREHGALGKVAARLRPDLIIEAGNHGATTAGTALRSSGFVVRHFSWRSPEQYVRKIRNGERAYAATDLPPQLGVHWRMWEGVPDEALADHFRTWFWSADPTADSSLIYDPAPGK